MATEVGAQQARDEAPETTRALASLGAVAALTGAFVLFVSTLLHPLDSDPDVPRAAFAEYAADSLWVGSHLGQFLGVAFLGAALAALAGFRRRGDQTRTAANRRERTNIGREIGRDATAP